MSNEKAPEKKKKKNKGNTIFILIIALLAAICLFLWKFGFGFGGGNGTGSDSGAGNASQTETVSETAESGSTETTAETEAETNSLSVEIVVSDDKISANGDEMADAAALKDYLLSNHVSSEDGSEGTKYTLVDSHALKSAYDSAKAVLDELGYEYSEQTAEE